MVDTKRPMRWGRFTIRDFHDYGPRLTVEDVIVKSSNIGAARIGLAMGGEPPAATSSAGSACSRPRRSS